jgi:uroporphyrinogen-III synthase
MKVIITRPRDDARPLAEKLRAAGYEPITLPLLDIVPRAGVTIQNRVYQAVCVTSANALRMGASFEQLKSLPVLCVGPQSLQQALDSGFKNASAHGGDVDGLVAYIKAVLKPTAGPLLYLSGAETSGDLQGQLNTTGFEIDRVVTYDAKPITLAGHEQDVRSAAAVLLYSPRSAKIWAAQLSLMVDQNIGQRIQHFCLSKNVAAVLPQSWPRCTAEVPHETAMLAALASWRKAE